MTTNQTTESAWQPAANVAGIAPRTPGEMPLFTGCLIFSLLVCAGIAMLLIRLIRMAPPTIFIPIFIIVAVVTFISFAIRAGFVAHVRGNGMLVGPDQLGDVYEAVQKVAQRMDMPMPQLYVVQFGGIREGIVKIFLGSRILVLSSKLLEDCGEGGELDMAIGKELAHFRFHHIHWRFWLFPSMLLPMLYPAWRRATEYTADRYGLLACGDFAVAERRLYIDAAGGRLGRSVVPESYHGQLAKCGGFWTTLRYLLGGEPDISWRVSRLLKLMPEQGDAAPAPRKSIFATILCAFVPGASASSLPGGGAGSMVAVVFIAVFISALVPAIAMSVREANEARDMRDLHEIGQATLAYTSEHETLPPSREALLKMGLLPEDVFRSDDGEEIHYLVEELIERGQLSIDRLPPIDRTSWKTVLFYRRAGSDYLVVFADGRVDVVYEYKFEDLMESSIRQLSPIRPREPKF
jgi:Zn-dependent protease with chaperone function